MGSTKDTNMLSMPSDMAAGVGEYRIRDDYSVFDWAHQDHKMPDTIPGKGAASAVVGGFIFEQFENMGIPTHYKGMADEAGNEFTTSGMDRPTDRIRFKLVNVVEPKPIYEGDKIKDHDYSGLQQMAENGEGCYVLPAECLFRLSLPEGSSLLRRMRNGEIDPKDFGFDDVPEPYSALPNPVYDLTSKFEEWGDRPIGWDDLMKMGVREEEIPIVKDLVIRGSGLVKSLWSEAGLDVADGKFEFIYGPGRDVMFGDIAGALDEIRGLYEHKDGTWVQVSKEPARQYYEITDPEWVAEARQLKDDKVKDWQSKCSREPKPLDPDFRELLSQMYMAPANELLGRELFRGVPPLSQVVSDLHSYFEELKKKHQ